MKLWILVVALMSVACSATVSESEIEIYPLQKDFETSGTNYLACEADSYVMSCGCSTDGAIRVLSTTKVPPLGLNGCVCQDVDSKGTMRIEALCLRRKD